MGFNKNMVIELAHDSWWLILTDFHGWLRHVGDELTLVFQWGFNQSMENHSDISTGIDWDCGLFRYQLGSKIRVCFFGITFVVYWRDLGLRAVELEEFTIWKLPGPSSSGDCFLGGRVPRSLPSFWLRPNLFWPSYGQKHHPFYRWFTVPIKL